MYIYIYTYLHTYIPTYLHTYIPTYLHTYIPTYLHTYIPTYLHTYLPTYLHTCIHLYIYIYIYMKAVGDLPEWKGGIESGGLTIISTTYISNNLHLKLTNNNYMFQTHNN